MDSQSTYRVDTRNVVHETIEGEVIVIHLLNGSYYSLGGGGPEIWERLLDGATVGQISAAVPAEGAGEAEVTGAVMEFMTALAADGLIVAEASGNDGDPRTNGGDPTTNGGDPAGNGAGPPGRAPGTWVPPVFERYTDMKDYFLLDPIHEVDATGWPNRQAG
jgi:hypothetical protein